MTRRRWIADEVAGDLAFITGAHAAHISRVLRGAIGQEFDIVTPSGVRSGRITSIEDGRVEFALGDAILSNALPRVTILLSVFKFDRMEWAIEKCTELGVARIVPVISQRTEKHLASAAPKRFERWQRIASQASEQSRRPSVPEFVAPIRLKNALDMDGNTRIVLSESEKEIMLKDLFDARAADVLLAFGPEGGWAPEELKSFVACGWKPASLGTTILRAETAAIAATAIAMSQLQ